MEPMVRSFLFFFIQKMKTNSKNTTMEHTKFKIMRASTHTLPVSSVPKSRSNRGLKRTEDIEVSVCV